MKKTLMMLMAFLCSAATVFGQSVTQLVTDDELTYYYGQWANKNGVSPTEPGYVYDFLIPEEVGIKSSNPAEEAASRSRVGAVVQMIPTGDPSEMPSGADYYISTDEAMGYGMLIAVMMDDQELFNKFLRVSNYYDSLYYANLTSWIIPAKKGADLYESPEYKALVAKELAFEAEHNFGPGKSSWLNGRPSENWLLRYDPLYTEYMGKTMIVGDELEKGDTPSVGGIAMDGALDIAFALIMGHDKWVLNGTSEYKYLEMALERIEDINRVIAKHGRHINPDGSVSFYLPTGDFNYNNGLTGEGREVYHLTRPCDWMLGHLRAYYEVVGDEESKRVLASIQEQIMHFVSTDGVGTDTGLVPDFAQFETKVEGVEKLVPAYGAGLDAANEWMADAFYMNSARFAGRMAMDYLMYNDVYSLEKGVNIVKFLMDKDVDWSTWQNEIWAASRHIDSGEIANWQSWENLTLKANLILAAGAGYMHNGDAELKAFLDNYLSSLVWGFESMYAHYGDWQGVNEWDPATGNISENWYDGFTELSRDPGHTRYFEDTWALLALASLNGRWQRPHGEANLLDSLELTKGSEYASLSTGADGSYIVEITALPAGDDPFAITLSRNLMTRPAERYTADLVLERENFVFDSKVALRHVYPEISRTVEAELGISVFTDKAMHMSVSVDRAEARDRSEKASVLEIGLNSGIQVGSRFILTDAGFFPQAPEAAKYRYAGLWRQDYTYAEGDYVRYEMDTYVCIKSHEASAALNPKEAPLYWEKSDYTEIGSQWVKNTYYNKGELVFFQGKTYVALVSFTSVEPPAEAVSAWELYHNPFKGKADTWFAGAYYKKGDYVLFNGNAYICEKDNLSIAAWNPEAAWTLWTKSNSLFNKVDPQPWETWTPYMSGAVVEYNGVKYQCVTGHTAQPGWEPASQTSLWVVFK